MRVCVPLWPRDSCATAEGVRVGRPWGTTSTVEFAPSAGASLVVVVSTRTKARRLCESLCVRATAAVAALNYGRHRGSEAEPEKEKVELLAIQRRRGGGGRCEDVATRPALAPRQRDRVARAYVTVTTEVRASSLYYFGALPAPAIAFAFVHAGACRPPDI